jgi:hypothetical protein
MKITWYITYHVTWIITCNITWFYMYVASFCTCWLHDLLQEFYIMHYMMLYMILHRITCLLHVLLHCRLHQQLHDSARFITWLFTCDFTWFYMILHDYCIGYMEFTHHVTWLVTLSITWMITGFYMIFYMELHVIPWNLCLFPRAGCTCTAKTCALRLVAACMQGQPGVAEDSEYTELGVF